jgi:hypothetical protein
MIDERNASAACARVQADANAVSGLEGVSVSPATPSERADLLQRTRAYREAAGELIACPVRRDTALVGVIFVPARSSEEDASAIVADDLQDVIVGPVLAAAWPKCPLHEHQLLARAEEGRAVWKCPETNQSICDIGQYKSVHS